MKVLRRGSDAHSSRTGDREEFVNRDMDREDLHRGRLVAVRVCRDRGLDWVCGAGKVTFAVDEFEVVCQLEGDGVI